MPKTNTWAIISGLAVTVLVAILAALTQFFSSGAVWPVTAQGWLQIILPAAVAGTLSVLTPYYRKSTATASVRKG